MIKRNYKNHSLRFFSRWSRKKYAILQSLSLVIKICTLCVTYTIVKGISTAAAQNDTSVIMPMRELKEVEVFGKKNIVIPETGGIITSIPFSEFERFSSVSFQDVLEYAGNIDVKQRGRNGVQSDASIRGGSFDHVLVLLNGISMNDPQTGHASLDLPVDKDLIERIEVSYGPSSLIYGPGAFTGAVNIITRQSNGNSLSVEQEAGDFGLLKSHLNLFYASGPAKGVLSLSRLSSSGYAPETDFKTYNLFFNGSLSSGRVYASIQAGLQQKKFGAGGFYTPLFPHQYEKTGLSFGSIMIETGEKLKVSPSIFWRQRHDVFLLDRSNPSFYRNFHRSDVYGGRLNMHYSFERVTFISAFDVRSENILSSSLGYDMKIPVKVRGEDSLTYNKKFGRSIFSLSDQLIYKHKRFGMTAGITFLTGSGYKGKISALPALGFEYRFLNDLEAFVNYNMGSAMPSFTDLFYKDPNNEGSAGLLNASIKSFETGIKYSGDNMTGSLTVFATRGNNIIEWLWSDELSRYKPFNMNDYNASGFEGTVSVKVSLRGDLVQSVTMNYMYLRVRKPVTESVSKYNNLKNKFSVMISNSLPENFRISWNISYQDRLGSFIIYRNNAYEKIPYQPVWLADVNLEWYRRTVVLYIGATNILNIKYSDAGSLYQPGRWFSGGINIKLP